MGYQNERGNVFFALFGAVAVVGVIGAASMSIMRGPLTTMVEVNKRTQAESEMQIAAKLAVIEAIDDPVLPSGSPLSDCDGDNSIEPIPAKAPGAEDAPVNGGFLPDTFGVSKTDPWGTKYGYCVWDAGATVNHTDCNTGGSQVALIDGDGASTDYTIISIVSAGPDRVFNTTCNDFATADANNNGSLDGSEKLASKPSGADDIIMDTTYGVAQTFAGGLWKIKATDSNKAEIAKDLEVTGGASFSGASKLDLSGLSGSLLLPDENTSGSCTSAANEGVVRRYTLTDPPTLQICDYDGGAGAGWVNVAAGASDLTKIEHDSGDTTTTKVEVNDTTKKVTVDVDGSEVVAINATSLNAGALNIVTTGTLAAGNTTISGTLGAGATTVTTLNATGAVDFDSTLDVQGAISNSAANVTISDNLDISGDVDVNSGKFTVEATSGNTVIAGTLNAQGNVDFDADANIDGNLVVVGTSDLRGNVFDSLGDLTLNDDTVINGTLDVSGDFAVNTNKFTVNATNGNTAVGGDLAVTGSISGSHYYWDGNDFTPKTCTSGQYSWWDGDSWECTGDQNDGSGGTPATSSNIEVVLQNGSDADGEGLENLGTTVIGDTAASGTLLLDVEGQVGAVQYCDEDGANCFTASGIASGFGNIFEVTGAAGSEVVRSVNAKAPHATSDFVFGSPQLADDADATHDSRMFFDKSKGAFRAGTVTGSEWDDANVGSYSVALGAGSLANGDAAFASGYNTIASGIASTAIGSGAVAGNGTAGSGLGDGSFAVGLIDDAVTLTTRPQVTGIQSMGIFMGDQDGVVMSANNTMGLFGGKFVIDPAVPATQLAARAALDVGAATDAVVLASGTTAQRPAAAGGTDVNGMIRYNSTTNRFEGYENGGWASFGTDSNGLSGKWKDDGPEGPAEIYYNGGNVGIGTNDPASELEVVGTAQADALLLDGVTGAAAPTSNIVDVLDDLSDVNAPTPATDEVLTFDGTEWIAQAVSGLIADDDLDWDKFKDAMTLDATTTIDMDSNSADFNFDSNTFVIDSSANRIGIGTATPGASLHLAGTDAIIVPSGTTAQQPGTPVNGMIRYNSTTAKFEGYQAGAWTNMISSSSGGVFQVAGAAGSELVSAVDASAPYATADFVFGSPQLADDGNSSHDARMFFDKSKGAFRAGYVNGTQWDNANVGDYSVALGANATAKGTQSFAVGNGSNVTGTQGIALGTSTTVAGTQAIALGNSASASNTNSTAIGPSSIASGMMSTSIGAGSTASGISSLSIGNGNVSSGMSSLSIGNGNVSSGINSTSMGSSVVAGDGTAGNGKGDGSFAIGLVDDAVTITTKPQVTGIQSMGIFMGDQDGGVIMSANNTMGVFGGKLVIDPAVPATQLTARATIDTGAATDAIIVPSGTTAQQPGTPVNGMIRYNSTTAKFEGYQAGAWTNMISSSSGGVFQVAGAAGSELVSAVDASAPYATADFVFGSPQLADDADVNHQARMFFDKSKGAFRAGYVNGTQWDNANVGDYSVALGANATAKGTQSFAVGNGSNVTGTQGIALGTGATVRASYRIRAAASASNSNAIALGGGATASGMLSMAIGIFNTASGMSSTAFGNFNTASGMSSTAFGNYNTASGSYSTAMGRFVVAGDGTAGNGKGDGSFAIGLVDDAVTITTKPQVTGIQSMGIFMGDQDGGVIMSANNTMGVFGGKLVIDPAVPATQLAARATIDTGAATDAIIVPSGTTAQQPGTPVNGMIRYNTDTPGFEVREAGAWVAMGSSVSDMRLKKDIVKLDRAETLEKLSQVQGYTYRLKDGQGQLRYGVIAQELEKVFPDLVDSPDNPDEMKSVRYQEFTALLVEAVKELKSENEILKAELATTKAKQDQVLAALDGLKQNVDGLNLHTGYGISNAGSGSAAFLMLLLMIGGGVVLSRRSVISRQG
ncbi:MAG: tail fiber domain-containing protein [Rhodospirillales bacterium]|nr:tail fiber domain-containing protein [Rhodospirillales bacterium]